MSRWLIVGGTGTLGTEMISQLCDNEQEVTCFSRDELKQKQLSAIFPKVKYVIGDIKDYDSIRDAVRNHDIVCHFAALKHIDVVEKNVLAAIDTNVKGTQNVARAAIAEGCSDFIFSSTDKAVLPINCYGMTKAICEKFLLNFNEHYSDTKFRVFRWGNVVGSRGSAINMFIDTLLRGDEVSITDLEMTRFWIPIQEAVRFVLDNFQDAPENEVVYPPMKAAPIVVVVKKIAEIIGVPCKFKVIGIRPGEKIHECLYSSHSYCINSNNCEQFSDAELDVLLREIVTARQRQAA